MIDQRRAIDQNKGMLHYWLQRLEDPFETFSMQAVTRSLGKLAEKSDLLRLDREGPWKPPAYDVEDEHDIEVVEHLIGVDLARRN